MTILLIAAVWAHALVRVFAGQTFRCALSVVLAAIVTVGALEVPH